MTTQLPIPSRHSLWLVSALLILTCLFIQATTPAQASPKRAMTIDDLTAITDIQTMTLSPDGKYVAFQTIQGHKDSNSFTIGWHIAATKAGAKVQKMASGTEVTISFGGNVYSSQIIWTPDSDGVYFTKKHDGAVQIWHSARRKPMPRQVTHNAGDVRSLALSPDGSKVFFTIGRTRAEFTTLKVKIADQGIIHQEPGIYNQFSGIMLPFCTDGHKRRPDHLNQKYSCRLTDWVYIIKTAVERPATKTETDSLPDPQDDVTRGRQRPRVKEGRQMEKRAPNGRQRVWIENENPGIYKGAYPPMVLRISDHKGKDITCPATACMNQKHLGFKGLWWHPNGKDIIFHVIGNHNSLNIFYRWTPGETMVHTILTSDDHFKKCDLVGKRLICFRSAWTVPQEIAAINLNDGKITTLVNVNPAFKHFKFTRVEKIFGEDDNGHKVFAHLVYPKGYKKGQSYPLVVTGYVSRGFLRGGTGDDQPIHAYAQQGIAVLSFNHNHSTYEYDKKEKRRDYLRMGWHTLYIEQSPATAIENMVAGLVKRGIIDPARIGLTGFSWGEQTLATSLMRRNYAAAASTTISSIPIYDKYTRSSGSWGKMHDDVFGPISSVRGQEIRRKISLDVNAQRIDTPWLVQTADSEFTAIEVSYNTLKNAHKPIEMIIYPDERHSKWQPAHKYMVYRRNLDWFNFWLQGKMDKAPEKAAQYQRWHKLQGQHQVNIRDVKKEKNRIANLTTTQ